ncbi:MAG: ABC transporter permease, partial [Gemmatimonadetes bacterium]|nr:ABC transporter permease [Gemmatimonadota bacterium]
MNDLRYALRGLRNSPGFTAAVVLTLALGIGANAAVFDVLDRLLLRPPPHVEDAERVVRLYLTQRSPTFAFTSPVTSYAVFRDLRDNARSVTNLAAFYHGDVSVGRGLEAEKARGSLVSDTYFPLLGVRPALGRFFAAEEDRVAATPVVVLSYGYWRRRFAGDSTALGRDVWLAGEPFTVIGVAPRGFTGVNLENVDLWVPIERANRLVFGHDLLGNPDADRGSFWLQIIAQLPETISLEAAEAEMSVAYRGALRVAPGGEVQASAEFGPIQQARGPQPDQTVKVSRWLAAVAVIVLLIACANAANLMLTAGVRRRQEIAVRLALGGGRGRLLRQLLVENLCLALVAGLVAVLVAAWTGPALRAFLLPRLPPPDAVLDLRVFAVATGATLLAGLLSGLMPAWQGSRVELVATLKSGSRGAERRSAVRTGLLVTQVALTLVLLAGAGLFVRSLQKVRALDLGVDAERVLVATMDLRKAGRPRDEANALYLRMLDRLAQLPGVDQVAAAISHPFGPQIAWIGMDVPGRDSLPELPGGGPYTSMVTPGYFETIGTEITRGRGFTAADGVSPPRVAVISETWARMIWPDEDPVGQCVRLSTGPQCAEVVGIAEDVRRFAVVEEPHRHLYVPMGQRSDQAITGLLVRARGDPEAL